MDETDYQRYNEMLLQRAPFLSDAWHASDEFWDHREAPPMSFYNDVLRDAMPDVVTSAVAGDKEARERLSAVLALAESLCDEHDGVALVEGGMMGSLVEAAIYYWPITGMMGSGTRELFDLAWGPEENPAWLKARRQSDVTGQPILLGVLGGDLEGDRADEKVTTYWRVKTSVDPTAPPEWEPLDGPPATTDGLHGDLKIENDDQIMLVYFADEAAQERVFRGARDAAALAQEWTIPHRPADGSDS